MSATDSYKLLFDGDTVLMATGLNFPDALAGGVLGSKSKAPIFLVNGTGSTSAPVKSAIAGMDPKDIYILGGKNVLTDSVINNHVA